MLKKRLRLKSNELRLINEILKSFTKYDDLYKILDNILRVFYGMWNVEHSFIALYDPKIGELRVTNSFGFLPSEINRGVYAKGEGITGKTFQLGIPMFATEDELINKTGLLERVNFKELNFFTAPIKAGSETIGVIGIFKELFPNESIEKILETLSIIGVIIGNFIYLKEKFEKEKQLLEEKHQAQFLMMDKQIAKYGLIGVSEATERLKNLLKHLSGSDIDLLIRGEYGTGKTLIAKIIHLNYPRKDKPLHILDLRNVPQNLLEIEIFGFEGNKKQPFKPGILELADGGTLIIKHIELLPQHLQQKLLRFIKTKTFERVGSEEPLKVNVRIIATAPVNLREYVNQGKFLQELYDHLSLVDIYVPSLRERPEDIPLLVSHLLKKYNQKYGKNVNLQQEVINFLTRIRLPENIKHLDKIVHRVVLLSEPNKTVSLEDLKILVPDLVHFEEKASYQPINKPKESLPLPKQIEEEEKQKIIWALEQTDYIKSRAAKLLGYTLRQLDYRIKKYGIEVKRRKKA
ncbi:MAG: sigma 54-interacting transcriptional regulator, partial [Aquificota bacterium]